MHFWIWVGSELQPPLTPSFDDKGGGTRTLYIRDSCDISKKIAVRESEDSCGRRSGAVWVVLGLVIVQQGFDVAGKAGGLAFDIGCISPETGDIADQTGNFPAQAGNISLQFGDIAQDS